MSIKAVNWVLRHVKAKPEIKMILVSMADNSDDNGFCFPSMQHIAEKSCVSTRTVKRKIKYLEEKGVIQIHRRSGGWNKTFNQYRLRLEYSFDLISTPSDEASDKLSPSHFESLAGQGIQEGQSDNLAPAPKEGSDNETPADQKEPQKEGGSANLAPGVVTTVSPGVVTELCHPKRHIKRHMNSISSKADEYPFAMYLGWQPGEIALVDISESLEIPTSFSKQILPAFRKYWQGQQDECNQQVWESRFIEQVRYKWDRTPVTED